MFAVGLPELLVVALLLLLGMALVLGLGPRRGTRVPASRETRLVAATRALGVVVGLVVARQVAGSGSYGTGPMLAAVAFGDCLLLAVVVGETVVRPARRGGGPRAASLHPRRVVDYLPRRLSTAIAVQTVALLALLALTTATASTDPSTGTTRALSCAVGAVQEIRTPYPGLYYSRSLLLALLATLVVAALAARQVVRRPRGAGPVSSDDALRRRSARVVSAALGIAVSGPYCGVAVIASSALLAMSGRPSGCASAWFHPVGLLVAASVVPTVGLLLGCVATLLLDRARVQADKQGTAGPAGSAGSPSPTSRRV